MTFERIQEALFFWRTHFLAIALIVVPFSLLAATGEIWLGPMANFSEDGQTLTHLNSPAVLWAFFAPVLTEAALIPQLAAIQAGKPRGLADCLLIALSLLPVLVAVNLVIATTTLLGFMFLILPGLWIHVRLSLAPFIAALEGASPRLALKQSFIRTDAIQWPMLGAWLLTLLMVLSLANILGAVLFSALGEHGGSRLLLGVLLGLGSALLHVLLFRFYGLTRPNDAATSGNNLH